MQEQTNRINYLLDKYLSKECTREEFDELFECIQDPTYEKLIKERMDSNLTLDNDDIERTALTWEVLQKRMEHPRKINPYSVVLKYVAAAVIVLSALGIAYWNFSNETTTDLPYEVKMDADVLPGKQKAILTLADGSQILLDESNNGQIAKEGDATIHKETDGSITYMVNDSDQQNDHVYMNRLSTPVAAQYTVVLPDKTKIWLNAMSSIEYPSEFMGDERVVKLQGEAYFEVAKDPDHPFIVKSARSEVKVLGTEFNISDYESDSRSSVTLRGGSVALQVEDKKTLLEPGQQAAFSSAEDLNLAIVDVDGIIDWTQGYFLFDNANVTQVMSKIRRWYDIEVIYEGEKPDVRFTGMVSRDSNLSKILTLLQSTGGVNFEIKNQSVIVSTN